MDMRFTQAREWLSGYLTAYNWYRTRPGIDIAAGTDREGMYAWLDKFCRDNPTLAYGFAVSKLVEYLRPTQGPPTE